MARDRSCTYKDGGLRGGETKAGFGDDDAAGDVMTGNGERASAGCCRAAGVGVEAEVEAAEGGGRTGVRAASSSVSGRSACCIPKITGVWLSFATTCSMNITYVHPHGADSPFFSMSTTSLCEQCVTDAPLNERMRSPALIPALAASPSASKRE